MKSRDRRAERMSKFVTNMFQYNVTVGITRSEVISWRRLKNDFFLPFSFSQTPKKTFNCLKGRSPRYRWPLGYRGNTWGWDPSAASASAWNGAPWMPGRSWPWRKRACGATGFGEGHGEFFLAGPWLRWKTSVLKNVLKKIKVRNLMYMIWNRFSKQDEAHEPECRHVCWETEI